MRGRCTASDTAVVAMERGLLVLVVGVVVAQAAHHNHVLSQTFIGGALKFPIIPP